MSTVKKSIVKTESVTFEDPSGAALLAQPSQRKDLTNQRRCYSHQDPSNFPRSSCMFSNPLHFLLDILFIENKMVIIVYI